MIQPSPYPWHSVDRIPRGVLPSLRIVRDALRTAFDPSLAAARAEDLLREPVRVLVQRIHPLLPGARSGPGATCLLRTRDGSVSLLVTVEPALAARIASALLGRPPAWVDETASVPPLIQAAVGAFVSSVARRAARLDVAEASGPDQTPQERDGPSPSPQPQLGSGTPLRLAAVCDSAVRQFAAASGTVGVVVDATFLVGDDAFAVSVSVIARPHPTRGEPSFTRDALRSLGDVGLTLRIVAACSASTAVSISAMGPGDAWMPGEGWTIAREGAGLRGRVALCTPHGETGLLANLHADGRIVLGEGFMRVDADESEPNRDAGEMATPGASEPTVADVLADVPLLVRVEIGAVTLRAREWAALQAGDVLMTGARIAERVSLRIGGVEVAQGELVDVDGELGVRIHSRTTQGGAP